jgi:hypothetical protein
MAKRVLGLGAIAVLVFAVYAVAPAAADTTNPAAAPNRFVNGQWTGTGSFTPSTACIVHQDQTLTSVASIPPYTFTSQVSICIDVFQNPFVVTGTFVSTYGNGATLSGTINGIATLSSFSGTETVTSGTGQFSHVTGTIDYSGTATPFMLQGTSVGHLTYSG